MNETKVTHTSDRDVMFTRLVNAPRDIVFQAWTDPTHLDQWWGPDGFTTTTESMDVRPGGHWRYMMVGPDGTDYPNLISYREVVTPELLVYDHGDFDNPEQFQVTVTFAARDGKTEIRMQTVFPTAEALRYVVENFGAIEGGKQTVASMAEYVETKLA